MIFIYEYKNGTGQFFFNGVKSIALTNESERKAIENLYSQIYNKPIKHFVWDQGNPTADIYEGIMKRGT